MFKNILLATVLLISAATASAEVVTFTWDPVVDDRVAVYVLGRGSAPAAKGGVYKSASIEVKAPSVSATTPDIPAGTFYFAVKACNADKSLCSAWSNEVKVVVKTVPIAPPTGLKIDSMTSTIK